MAIVTNGSSTAIPPIKTEIGAKYWRARRSTSRFVGRTVGSTVAMSITCGAAVLLASQLRTGSPWTGLNAMAVAAGVGPRRAKRRFDAGATLAGAGVLAAGLLLFASLYQGTETLRRP